MNTTLKQVLRGLALAAALAGGAQADTLTLEDLFGGRSLTIGDKTFDSFSLVAWTPSDPARTFDASKINVQTLADDGSGYGIAFAVTDSQLLSVTGDGA